MSWSDDLLQGRSDELLRWFACDCAQRAIDRIDNPDQRSINDIKTARLYTLGLATKEELNAAWSASRPAAIATARDAAWYACRSAAVATSWYAARDAAWYAAWDAAWYASWYAARNAEREWQAEHIQYLSYLESIAGERTWHMLHHNIELPTKEEWRTNK